MMSIVLWNGDKKNRERKRAAEGRALSTPPLAFKARMRDNRDMISLSHMMRFVGYSVFMILMSLSLSASFAHAYGSPHQNIDGGIAPSTQGSDGYALLEPSILVHTGGTSTSPSQYLENIFYFMIGTAGVLAVLMIAIGGIEYMFAGANPGKMKDAQEKIWAAIFGVVLAVGAWLILNTINPDLTDFNLTLSTVTVGGNGGVGGGGSVETTRGDIGGSMAISSVEEDGTYSQEKIHQEKAMRKSLAARGIKVVGSQTNEPCQSVQRRGCTDLYGIKKSVSDELDYIRDNVDGTIYITGGTEFGHATGEYSHQNGYKVDLRKTDNINDYVKDNFTYTPSLNRTGTFAAKAWVNNETGAIWYEEDTHWDVLAK